MARIADRLLITAPVELVFDTVADTRNEPLFNPSMTSVELLTPEPIGVGTRFRTKMGKRGFEMFAEVTEYERPHRLGSRITSSLMEVSGVMTFKADGETTTMAWDWQVQLKGWLRVLSPGLGPLGRRGERRIWAGLKHMLESTPAQLNP